ncbi:alpha/beta hydrolase family protein [Seonamhaeicola maritimus]|uniref:Prolyl oligopeptidase family serine peptidase n=1 Tax=Seonamhaeicola maritimus TaxID=2591822 RepID=A0A5C7GJ93_9FLAO|nr:prolyl oligopeptidase family serine peptidase [Seonamhaeicola maritimus]TXG38420.1 prolyl oligopeptidase family serine peptidase [Seonamhaeicola maritimus]
MKLYLFFTIGFLTLSYGQKHNPTSWKSFERHNLKFENREARVIVPNKALEGNPWIWKARFPKYHAGIDSTLVAKGFHLAYINTDNMFGCPEAVKIRNRFYDFIVSKYKLQKKVALHGHSRGGLFTYNWAKKNPEKVACIYVDAPVCDIKSWPAGFGTSKGSRKEWEILKKEYGFKSDEEAKDYKDNPLDNLEQLANAKVSILHTISLKDEVVPPEENSIKLVNNYIRLGGKATIYPCVEGIQKSNGHHYDIDNPKIVIDFIKRNTLK